MSDGEEKIQWYNKIGVKRKIAVFTCGRLQPPGKGHKELIEAVYDIAHELDLRKETENIAHALPYVWVSPSYKEIRNVLDKDSKNPISTLDKLHYLNKMYPEKTSEGIPLFDKLTFLTARSNLDVAFREKMQLKDDFTPKQGDFEGMKLCQWKKWTDESGSTKGIWKTQGRIRSIRENSSAILDPTGRFVPSKAVILWLIGQGYNEIHIRVGSDRIKGFINWNLVFLNSLKNKGKLVNFSIHQVGGDRGDAGQGILFDGAIIDGYKEKPGGEGEDLEYEDSTRESDSEYDPSDEIEGDDDGESMAGKVSGTQMRYFACHFETIDDNDKRSFIDKSKIGNMTIIDIFCLINDIKVGSMYPKIKWKPFWRIIKRIYKNSEMITQFTSEYRAFKNKRHAEKYQYVPGVMEGNTARTLFNASSGLMGGRKTRKKRKKKRRKKTRKMKERIVKFMRGPGAKKYTARVMHKKTRKIRHIHFGAKGYEQFKDSTPLKLYSSKNHGTKKRRDNYFSRHSGGIKNKKKALSKEIRKSKGLYNAKILSHKYLW